MSCAQSPSPASHGHTLTGREGDLNTTTTNNNSDSAITSSPPPSSDSILTRNQQLKHQRRKRQRAHRQSQLELALQSDPLCQRIVQIHSTFQAELQGRWRFGAGGIRNTYDIGEEQELLNEQVHTSVTKKCKIDPTDTTLHEAAAAASSIIQPAIPAAAASASRGVIIDQPDGMVIDQAMQIAAAYTRHRLTDTGEFKPFEKFDTDDFPSKFVSVCELFRLDAPYHERSSIPTSLSSDSFDDSSSLPNTIGAWRNDGAVDSVVEIDGRLYVMPPHSTALSSDISQAAPQLRAARPVDGFNLIVMDPVCV